MQRKTVWFAVVLGIGLTIGTAASGQAPFRRGDLNGNGSVEIADPIAALGVLFGGEAPTADCEAAYDANGDDEFGISDAVYSLSYLFAGGAAPPAPFPGCGATAGGLSCVEYSGCGGPSGLPFEGSVVFVSQVPSDAGEMQISDLHGSFLGDNPERDQPVGGNLLRLDPGATTPVNLTQQSNAAVRNPELSWDGLRVVFSMKVGATGNWQIYEIGVDGSGLRQVADTPFNETEPVYLPDGRIVFASDRLGLLDGYENFPTGQLFVMNPDGAGARLLTYDSGGDLTPDVMEDGRISFTRWHAVVKNPCRAQADPIGFSPFDASRFLLWAVEPDGNSDGHPIYGDHIIEDFRGGIAQSRPLRDGTGRFLTTIATAETWGAGGLAIVDPAELLTATQVPTPVWVTFEGDYSFTEGVPPSGGRYRDPYVAAAGDIVVSFAEGSLVNDSFAGVGASTVPNFGLYRLNMDGSGRTVLYDDPNQWEIEPIEIALRPVPPILPGTLDLTQDSGILNTMDVRLRAQLPPGLISPDEQSGVDVTDAAWIHIFKGVPSQLVYPPFHNYRQVQPALIGRAPVLSDGSFAARVPADEPIIWSLVNSTGDVLIEERFWNHVRPGQTQTCRGCHSPKEDVFGSTTNLALASPTDLTRLDPSRLIPGAPAAVASRAQWFTDQPRQLDENGIPVPEIFAVDNEARSDHDTIPGQATVEFGLCFNVDDPRLFGPLASTNTDIAEVRLVQPSFLNPASAEDLADATALIDAIAALGMTVTESGMTLMPGQPVSGEVCTERLQFVVPADSSRQVQLIAVDSTGIETTCSLTLRAETALPPRPFGEEREDPEYPVQGAYDVQGVVIRGKVPSEGETPTAMTLLRSSTQISRKPVGSTLVRRASMLSLRANRFARWSGH